jgi:hypothetical protein
MWQGGVRLVARHNDWRTPLMRGIRDKTARAHEGLRDTPTRRAASQLDLAQAAMLAGLPQLPIAHDPYLFPRSAASLTVSFFSGSATGDAFSFKRSATLGH